MTLLVFFLDQSAPPVEILLDEGIVGPRKILLQLRMAVVSFHVWQKLMQ
jgi:hypothetical protein